jgi:hypothetical protein
MLQYFMTFPKLLDQFRSFYFRNYPDDMEIQIAYFSIFGGLGFDIDTSKPLELLIKEHILDNFKPLQQKIKELTCNQENNKRLLRALAIGDRRIFSAFNKAGLNNGNGGAALSFLQEKGLVTLEYSREVNQKKEHPNQKLKREISRHRISHKVLFTQPFIRFWFYFVSPHKKEILEGDFENFYKNFAQKKNSYTSLIFEELSEVLLNYHIRDAQILSSGSYWDANLEIDILTFTDKDQVYVAECKWTNHIINKKEYHKLLEKCSKIDINPTQVVFFSKRGFSKELTSMQSASLALYSAQEFSALVKSPSENIFIESFLP